MFAIIRTALVSLRRDKGALALSFVLPVVFFTIFAVIFGGRRNSTPKIQVLVVDEDHSHASGRLGEASECVKQFPFTFCVTAIPMLSPVGVQGVSILICVRAGAGVS